MQKRIFLTEKILQDSSKEVPNHINVDTINICHVN